MRLRQIQCFISKHFNVHLISVYYLRLRSNEYIREHLVQLLINNLNEVVV